MPILDRRLTKLEANQPPPPPMSSEERVKRIDELLAKSGTSLAQEIELHGSFGAVLDHARKHVAEQAGRPTWQVLTK